MQIRCLPLYVLESYCFSLRRLLISPLIRGEGGTTLLLHHYCFLHCSSGSGFWAHACSVNASLCISFYQQTRRHVQLYRHTLLFLIFFLSVSLFLHQYIYIYLLDLFLLSLLVCQRCFFHASRDVSLKAKKVKGKKGIAFCVSVQISAAFFFD